MTNDLQSFKVERDDLPVFGKTQGVARRHSGAMGAARYAFNLSDHRSGPGIVDRESLTVVQTLIVGSSNTPESAGLETPARCRWSTNSPKPPQAIQASAVAAITGAIIEDDARRLLV